MEDYQLLLELNLRGGLVASIFFIPRGTKSGDGDIGSNNLGGCCENEGEFIFNPLALKPSYF